MKTKTLSIISASILTAALGFSAITQAGPEHRHKGKDVERSVIKVEAEKGENVVVVVGENGEKNKYDFDFDELNNMDNVAAELDDLDPEVKEQVLNLLNRVSQSDATIIEFKDANISVEGKETDIFMVKTGNGEDELHVEIDVEGAGANKERVLMHKLLGGKGHHKRMVFKEKKGGKRDAAKMIKKIISKADLTPAQIEEIKAALDAK